MKGIERVFAFFQHMDDPDSKHKFFVPTWKTQLQKSLQYVAEGYLSDNPTLSQYIHVKTLRTGFKVYRCTRTSSPLEGYHKWLRMLVEHCYHASAEWLDSVANAFDFRWNVRAGRTLKLQGYENGVCHFDIDLRNAIANCLSQTPFQTQAQKQLPNFFQLKDIKATVIHGLHFAKLASLHTMQQGVRAMEDVGLDLTMPSRIVMFKKDPNQEEAELLVRAAATMDPLALSKYANAMGIMWSPKVATSWVADRAIKEGLWLQMAWENFPTLYGALRQTQGQATTTQRASAVVEMPIVHSGADHLPQASRTQGYDQPVYFPSGPLQRVPGAAAVAVDPTAIAAVAAATNSTTTTRTGPRPTTLALSPNSQEVKRKKREQQQALRAKRKREEAAVAQAQVAEKATKNALYTKKSRLKKKK